MSDASRSILNSSGSSGDGAHGHVGAGQVGVVGKGGGVLVARGRRVGVALNADLMLGDFALKIIRCIVMAGENERGVLVDRTEVIVGNPWCRLFKNPDSQES